MFEISIQKNAKFWTQLKSFYEITVISISILSFSELTPSTVGALEIISLFLNLLKTLNHLNVTKYNLTSNEFLFFTVDLIVTVLRN